MKEALSHRRREIVAQKVRMLYGRQLHFGRTTLTNQDLLEMFVNADDRDMVRRAADLFRHAKGGGWTHRFEWEGHRWEVRIISIDKKNDPAFMFPHYIGKHMDTSHPGFEKLTQWVRWRKKLADDFAYVNAALNYLYDRCESITQLRFYWEPIITLLSMDETTKDFADKHAALKIPTKFIPMDDVRRELLTKSAGVITLSMLLPDPTENPRADEEDTVRVHTDWSDIPGTIHPVYGSLPRVYI